ncbi:DUF648 domain-containing protein [Candidatus Chlamydia corallus]|uniref:DUF648 domain-containing protein n=1 Tax=Candidatus Chlamydia corallus TaxID=2038470 RepID=UPI001EFE7B9E|nr:DUF648 domain-containing protein [Candidatus Chlamydia corallus]
MKVLYSSYSLNSHYEKPSCLEKAVETLDSYFYWGEDTTDVLARDDISGELYCVRRPGRELSTAEKITKILSCILFPVVLIALVLRFILHKILDYKYKTVFIEQTVANETYPAAILKFQRKVRETYFHEAGCDPAKANQILNAQGICLLDIYHKDRHSVFTFSVTNYPTLRFTFVSSKHNEINGLSKTLDNILVEAMVRRTNARNLLTACKIQKFQVPKVVGLSLKSGLLISKLDFKKANFQELTEDFLNNPENKEGPCTDPKHIKSIKTCVHSFFNFAFQAGRSGIIPGKKTLTLNVNDAKTSDYSCVFESIGFFNEQSLAEKHKQQTVLIRKILKTVPPSFLKGLIMKLPKSLKCDRGFMSSLIFDRLSYALDLSAPIHTQGKQNFLYEEKLDLIKEYLSFLAKRYIERDPKTRRYCKVSQKFGGETIDAETITGELFHKPDKSEPGDGKLCLGESILKQLVALGIITGYENKKREVWIYLD